MKINMLLIGAVAFVACSWNDVAANVMTKVSVVQPHTSDEYVMHDSGKMYFSEDCLVLDAMGDGNVQKVPIAEIDRLTFSIVEVSSIGEASLESSCSQTVVDVSSSRDNLVLHANRAGMFAYSIFSANGRLLATGEASNGSSLDISKYPNGVYFLKVENTYIKFSK